MPLPEDLSTVQSCEAVKALAKALKEDRLTLLSIGAATNIAILLLKYPELEERIDEIVLVAGRRHMDQHFFSGRWQPKPFRDLNFEWDPRAFEILLKGKRARLANRGALENWNRQPVGGQLDYRWQVTKSYLADIAAAEV